MTNGYYMIPGREGRYVLIVRLDLIGVYSGYARRRMIPISNDALFDAFK